MAITDAAEFAHLSRVEVAALGTSLDTIRSDVESSRGVRDADYVRRMILAQRACEAVARLTLLVSRRRSTWLIGT